VHGIAILEVDVVSCERECPCRCGRCEKRHGNAQSDFGGHIAYGFSYRRGEIVDHQSGVGFGAVEVGGLQRPKRMDIVKLGQGSGTLSFVQYVIQGIYEEARFNCVAGACRI
jgi:hypothetical protein